MSSIRRAKSSASVNAVAGALELAAPGQDQLGQQRAPLKPVQRERQRERFVRESTV
jgi:hypothetical protein